MANEKLAVVTGASSGIGYHLAQEFAQNGFDLIICSEGPDIDNAANQLRAHGGDVEAVIVDLAEYDGVEQLYNVIEKAGRSVDAIALNAGIGVSGDFARETSLQKEINLIELNVTSVVHLAKLVVKKMVERGEGKMLFTSSIAATMPGPYEAIYGASKAFEYSFAHALREELKDTGVTVTVLMPGPTETEFFRKADMEDTKIGQSKKDDPAEVAHDGFEALMKGDDHVIAGSAKNTMQAVAANILPDKLVAAIHSSMSKPGSGE